MLPTKLHAKFHRNWSLVGEKIFEGFFILYRQIGHGGHLGHVTGTIYKHFNSPFLKNLTLIGQVVSEIFAIVDDGCRRTEAGSWPSYKLTL